MQLWRWRTWTATSASTAAAAANAAAAAAAAAAGAQQLHVPFVPQPPMPNLQQCVNFNGQNHPPALLMKFALPFLTLQPFLLHRPLTTNQFLKRIIKMFQLDCLLRPIT